jgi:hypothetical protein
MRQGKRSEYLEASEEEKDSESKGHPKDDMAREEM